jgi:putative DNA primase/helicase
LLLSYLHDVVDILPLLLITSPEEECGKTTLAELVYNLSNRPIAASNISSAAVYRTIKDDCPTLILDEADTYLREDEILRGVINSGHKRKFAFVIRVVNDKGDTGQFTTWCPKAIAMIGLPKRTILSRSIHSRLGRKPKDIFALCRSPGAPDYNNSHYCAQYWFRQCKEIANRELFSLW